MDGAFGDYDAIASFDILILALMIPLVKWVGGVLAPAVCCYNIFKSMEYALSKVHGISEFKYRSTAEATLQGSGQGGSQSPIMCTCSSGVILDAMEEAGHPMEFEHPSRKEGTTSKRYSDQFVDDQSNGAVLYGDGIEECAIKLEINGNLSNSLLNASGGGDNIDKIYCYLIEQVSEDGEWRMLDENENPDIQVRIEYLDNGGNSILKRINPSEYRRTLGYNLNATNDNTELTKVLVAKAKKYNEALY
jgi:hypothetical protein